MAILTTVSEGSKLMTLDINLNDISEVDLEVLFKSLSSLKD